VVQGYEVGGERRGLYVSHEAIVRFLRNCREGPRVERQPPKPGTQYSVPSTPRSGLVPCPT
jgi:hypothetical protein